MRVYFFSESGDESYCTVRSNQKYERIYVVIFVAIRKYESMCVVILLKHLRSNFMRAFVLQFFESICVVIFVVSFEKKWRGALFRRELKSNARALDSTDTLC